MLALHLPLLLPFLAAPPAADEPDPALGIRRLYDVPYQGFGLSAAEFDRLWTVWPSELQTRAEALDVQGRRALARERYGLPLDPRRAKVAGVDVPVAFAANPDGQWTLSCLACHGGDVRGTYVEGLGNSRFAFQTLVRDVLWLRRKERREFSEQDEGMAIATLNSSDGATNAQVFSAIFLSFRDANLDRLEEPDRELLAGVLEHDLDAPALWNTRHRSRLYCDGYVEKDSRVIMQFALALENDGETIRGFEDDFRHVLAWMESLTPPPWPYDVDAALAAEGAEVFADTCARCHGTYAGTPPRLVRYPEKRVPVEEVGTDPVRLDAVDRRFKDKVAGSWLARYGEVDVDRDARGYVAPPLEGLWASAPYFHNGAVPTLWHVLHPDGRPAAWRRLDADGYDAERVGLPIEEAAAVPELRRADARRRWFDTTHVGKSAAGHDYPAQLSDEERRALLEFLKTL